MQLTILQTLNSDGAATVRFQLVQTDDTNLTNAQVIASTPARPFGLLKAKTKVSMILPAHLEPYTPKPFLQLQVVIAGAALTNTGGWLFAALGSQQEPSSLNRLYKSGYSLA